MTAAPDPARREGLAAALERVRARLAAAEAAASRPPGSVDLVVVTKTYPASDVALLTGLGVRAVGESREPEAGDKHASLAGPAGVADAVSGAPALAWHQVGQVQTRAARAVARWADVVHSVDRPRLVAALERGAEQAGRRLGVLVQVSLDAPDLGARQAGRAPRGGAAPGEVAALADAVEACEHLELLGLTGVAPRTGGPERAYDALAAASAALVRDHPGATWVSAGTSADLEVAVARGATVVRVGTAILGERPRMP